MKTDVVDMKLTPLNIELIGALANSLHNFYHDCTTYACVMRSRDLRRPNIKDRNADAVFAQETMEARGNLIGDLSKIHLDAGALGVSVGLDDDDIREFIDFCISRQLKSGRRWDDELTYEEKGLGL